MNCKIISLPKIEIEYESFERALCEFQENTFRNPLIEKQIELIEHRITYVMRTPLKVLSQDNYGYYKSLFIKEQERLYQLNRVIDKYLTLDRANRYDTEDAILVELAGLMYSPVLNFAQYDLNKEMVAKRTVLCHIHIGILNLLSKIMLSRMARYNLQVKNLYENMLNHFLIENPTSAFCVNNRLSQSLSLHFSYMPELISRAMLVKLDSFDFSLPFSEANVSFVTRLMINFSVYYNTLKEYKEVFNSHKVVEIFEFRRDILSFDPENSIKALDFMAFNKQFHKEIVLFLKDFFRYWQ